MGQVLNNLLKEHYINDLKRLWLLVDENIYNCSITNEYYTGICMWIKFLYDEKIINVNERDLLWDDLKLSSQFAYKDFNHINLKPEISYFMFKKDDIDSRKAFVKWRIQTLNKGKLYPFKVSTLKCNYHNCDCKKKVYYNVNYITYENHKINMNVCKNHIDYIKNWSNAMKQQYGFDSNLKILIYEKK